MSPFSIFRLTRPVFASLKRKFAEIRPGTRTRVLGANFHSKETKMYFVSQKMMNGDTP